MVFRWGDFFEIVPKNLPRGGVACRRVNVFAHKLLISIEVAGASSTPLPYNAISTPTLVLLWGTFFGGGIVFFLIGDG